MTNLQQDLQCDEDVKRELREQRSASSRAILRVFNYYRVALSFGLLLLFVQWPEQRLVGRHLPELFQDTIIAYIAVNTLVTFLCLVLKAHVVSRRDFVLAVLMLDVVFLTLLLYSSGGIITGLASFLAFPVAYAGVLVRGRFSVVIAAIAVILGFYAEFNLMMHSGEIDSRRIFSMGILGGVLFAINFFFQYLTVQLHRKEEQVVSLEQLTEARQLAESRQSELDRSNQKLDTLLEAAGDGFLGINLEGNIEFANPRAAQLLGTMRSKLIGSNIEKFVPAIADTSGEQSSFQFSHALHELEVQSRSTSSLLWQRSNGDTFPADYSCRATLNESGEIIGAVVVFQDVTERKTLEAEMYRLANHDPLTGLANRSFYQSMVEKALSRSRRQGDHIALLALDLDHFKYINDEYGHDAGDEVLKQVSTRISGCIRSCDTAARLGGDEFSILLVGFGSAQNLANIARSIIDAVATPVEFEGRSLNVSTSIGIAVFDEPKQTFECLMKSADTAMYNAKTGGRNTYRFFRPEMQHESERQQRIEVALRSAIQKEEFTIQYQPIVALSDPTAPISHSEALLRWTPLGEKPVSPEVFIPIAEQVGIIRDIGAWVTDQVLAQIVSWRRKTGVVPTVALNVSTRQLGRGQYRRLLLELLERYSLPTSAIEIELTETMDMRDPAKVMAELCELRADGIRIAIDDFGTGHSSLDYLRKLPVDCVKIDKSFVGGIGINQDDQNIIRVIVAIARAMKAEVVAEGIEKPHQLQYLRKLGCDYGQGYLFSKPVDSDAIMRRFEQTERAKVTRISDLAAAG